MKKIGVVLIAILFLSGCHASYSDRAFDCQINTSFNDISRERNGLFVFSTSAIKTRVYLIDNTLYIIDFERGEYTGYKMTENKQFQQVDSVKDFKVMINEGDLYYDDGRAIEMLSSDQKTIGFYYVEPSTGKIDSIQFLTQCQRLEGVLEDELSHAGHNH